MKFWQIVISQSEILWKPSRIVLILFIIIEFLLIQNVIILLNLIRIVPINRFIIFASFVVVALSFFLIKIIPRIRVSLPMHKLIYRGKSIRDFGLGNVWFLINDEENIQYEVLIYEPKLKLKILTFTVKASEIKEIFHLFMRFSYTNHGFWMKQSDVFTNFQSTE